MPPLQGSGKKVGPSNHLVAAPGGLPWATISKLYGLATGDVNVLRHFKTTTDTAR